MTNRTLAVDILVLTFNYNDNFDNLFYLNEILFSQNIKLGWEPKQIFIMLINKLLV